MLKALISGVAVFACTAATQLAAQGVATAGIQGTIRTADNAVLGRADVRVSNSATGYSVRVEARHGRFLVQGLEPGGPYSVTVRQVGFAPQRRDGLILALGELVELNWVLREAVVELAPTIVAAGAGGASPEAHGGTGTLIGGDLLHSLPNLNRDVYDIVRLVPQVSTRIGLPNPGFSAGGMGFRFNNFLIGGVSERTIGGNVSGAFAGEKSVPIDAVREYQVLLAPYDVRYGDFAGALVNAVTKSGTNALQGSAVVFARNDRLARASTAPDRSDYNRTQSALSIGGPIARDRLHFFFAAEFQRYTYPAPGPYTGQPANAMPPVPFAGADIERLSSIMSSYGLTAGSAGAMENGNPQRNFFTRLDVVLPSLNSRAAIWHSYGASDDITLSRRDTFSLSSSRITRSSATQIGALQIHTTLSSGGGGHNELLLSARSAGLESVPDVSQPIVRVLLPRISGGRETVNTGTPEAAQGTTIRSSAVALKDNLTFLAGRSHTVTLGVESEWMKMRRDGTLNAFGSWSFASLDDLQAGIAERYEVGLGFGSGRVPLRAAQHAAYVSDHWQATPTFSVTAGLRGDLLTLGDRAPYHAGVDSAFGRRTDQQPQQRVEVSPRLGFVLRMHGAGHRVRGGAGLFATRFPLAWAHTALLSYGAGGGVLRCGRLPADLGAPPGFRPDPFSPPQACANGASILENRRGDVDLLSPDLRMMRTLRGSLAYDRLLARDVQLTGELLVSRAISDFAFANLRLNTPSGTDRNGRVMYGSIGPFGLAVPNLRPGFSEVIEVINKPHTRAFQLSTRVEKKAGGRAAGMASYTYSRVRDAMTPLRVNTRGTVAWASARVVSGRHDDYTPGISSNDIPHRFVFAGTYSIPRRWRTEISFYYIGESGRPFTYVAFGSSRRGDLNADGVATNDPIYVPRNVLDEQEILFDGTPEIVRAQQHAFESLVERTPCLRRQRGGILQRNSCREPWSNITVATLRQEVPIIIRGLEAQLDVFNVLNLLNARWGLRREAIPFLLEHVDQTAGPAQASRSIFFFDSARPVWNTDAAASSFQVQAAIRYRF